MGDLYLFQLPGEPMRAAKIIGGLEHIALGAGGKVRLPTVTLLGPESLSDLVW
jgi:hypothetical protein